MAQVANRLTLLLLLLCVGLGALLAREWQAIGAAAEMQVAESNDSPASARKRAQPLPSLAPAASLQAYQEILARPLFIRSRLPPAKPKAAPVRQQVKQLHHLLEGVALSRNARVALLRDPRSREQVSLEQGQEWEGWLVEEVLADRVILSADGELYELLLEPEEVEEPQGGGASSRRTR